MAAETRPDLMGARGIVALAVATVGSVICGFAAVWVSLSHVSHTSAQSSPLGMQAILVGLVAIPVSWLILFFTARWAVGFVASRRTRG